MTRTKVFNSIKRHWESTVALVIGFITFGFLNVIFTRRIPIDTTGNFASAGSEHTARFADAMANGFWFPFIYGTLIAMIVYVLLEQPKYWYAVILANIALAMIFGFVQYQMIFLSKF